MEKTKGLPLRLSELGLARITRQTGYAVHFEIMQRYYVLKEKEEGCALCLKPLDGGRGHWKAVVSSWRRMPFPSYYGKRRVYAQAKTRSWMLSLVGRGIITLINDNNRPLGKEELLKSLSAEDAMSVFGIHAQRESACMQCDKNGICPVGKLGVRIDQCNYGICQI